MHAQAPHEGACRIMRDLYAVRLLLWCYIAPWSTMHAYRDERHICARCPGAAWLDLGLYCFGTLMCARVGHDTRRRSASWE
jgi:hypothetical protein